MTPHIRYIGRTVCAGGRISRIGGEPVEVAFSEGVTALPGVGGGCETHGHHFQFAEVISVGQVRAEAAGGVNSRGEHFAFSRAVAEEIVIRSEDVEQSTTVRIDYVRAGAGVLSRPDSESRFELEGVSIEGLDIDGHRLDIEFRSSMPEGARSIVKRLHWTGDPHPRALIDGHIVILRGFGRIYFGELASGPDSGNFSAIRMDLGSPIEGALQFGEVEVGVVWPASAKPAPPPEARDFDVALDRDITVLPPLEFGAPTAGEEPVQLTVHYPASSVPGRWHPLLAYVHTSEAMARVQERSRHLIGEQPGAFEGPTGQALTKVARGATITVVPELADCQVNPKSASFEWLEDLHAVEFRVRPGTGAITGRVTYYVGPILLGDVRVASQSSDTSAPPALDASGTSRPYRSVFVCYSHKDEGIAKLVELFYPLTGIESMRDALLLRTGEEWSPALAKAIENADVFQLMWSESAKASQHVRDEILHAVSLKREYFVRPMYWEKPMPEPPPELNPLHFVRLDLRNLVFVLSEQEDPKLKDLARRLLA